eukprot:12196555-Alexandrium_andersonii.AAC.1
MVWGEGIAQHVVAANSADRAGTRMDRLELQRCAPRLSGRRNRAIRITQCAIRMTVDSGRKRFEASGDYLNSWSVSHFEWAGHASSHGSTQA